MLYKSSGCTTQLAAKELGSALTAHLREKGKHHQVNMSCLTLIRDHDLLEMVSLEIIRCKLRFPNLDTTAYSG